MKKITLIILNILIVFFYGCDFASSSKERNFNSLCTVYNIKEIEKVCKDGDILSFMPSIYGNDQLPIIVSSLYCNFNYPIVWNVGGVSYVYTSERIKGGKD